MSKLKRGRFGLALTGLLATGAVVVTTMLAAPASAVPATAAPAAASSTHVSAATALPSAHVTQFQSAAATVANGTVTFSYGYSLTAGAHLRSVTPVEEMRLLNNGGHQSICVKYGFFLGGVQYMKLMTYIPGVSVTKSRLIFYLINRYAGTHSNTVGAALNGAVNLIVGLPSFVYDWNHSYKAQLNHRDARVVPLVNVMLAQAHNLSGGGATCKISHVLPGQTGHLTCLVLSATKHAVGGVRVCATFGGTNRTAAVCANTGSKGLVSFSFVNRTAGSVSYRYSVTLVQFKNGLVSQPAYHYQTLVSRGTKLVLTGSGSYSTVGANSTASSVCDTGCNGNSKVTVCARNAMGASPLQYAYQLSGTTGWKLVLTARGDAVKHCASYMAKDTQTYHFAKRWVIGSTPTAWKQQPNSLYIDCPRTPPVTFAFACKCDTAGVHVETMTVSVTTNDSVHNWKVVVTANGVDTATIIAPGKSFTTTVTAKGLMSISASAQKRSGSWTTSEVCLPPVTF